MADKSSKNKASPATQRIAESATGVTYPRLNIP
jgi:hypothetical protein